MPPSSPSRGISLPLRRRLSYSFILLIWNLLCYSFSHAVARPKKAAASSSPCSPFFSPSSCCSLSPGLSYEPFFSAASSKSLSSRAGVTTMPAMGRGTFGASRFAPRSLLLPAAAVATVRRAAAASRAASHSSAASFSVGRSAAGAVAAGAPGSTPGAAQPHSSSTKPHPRLWQQCSLQQQQDSLQQQHQRPQQQFAALLRQPRLRRRRRLRFLPQQQATPVLQDRPHTTLLQHTHQRGGMPHEQDSCLQQEEHQDFSLQQEQNQRRRSPLQHQHQCHARLTRCFRSAALSSRCSAQRRAVSSRRQQQQHQLQLRDWDATRKSFARAFSYVCNSAGEAGSSTIFHGCRSGTLLSQKSDSISCGGSRSGSRDACSESSSSSNSTVGSPRYSSRCGGTSHDGCSQRFISRFSSGCRAAQTKQVSATKRRTCEQATQPEHSEKSEGSRRKEKGCFSVHARSAAHVGAARGVFAAVLSLASPVEEEPHRRDVMCQQHEQQQQLAEGKRSSQPRQKRTPFFFLFCSCSSVVEAVSSSPQGPAVSSSEQFRRASAAVCGALCPGTARRSRSRNAARLGGLPLQLQSNLVEGGSSSRKGSSGSSRGSSASKRCSSSSSQSSSGGSSGGSRISSCSSHNATKKNNRPCSTSSERGLLVYARRTRKRRRSSETGERKYSGVDSLCMRGRGSTRDYHWEEEDDVVKVFITVEKEARGSDVHCVIEPESLYVKLLSKQLPLVCGKLKGRVSSAESYWTLETLDAAAARRFYRGAAAAADDEELQASPTSSSLPPPRPPPAAPALSAAASSSVSSASPAAAAAPPRVPTLREMRERPWLALDVQDAPAAASSSCSALPLGGAAAGAGAASGGQGSSCSRSSAAGREGEQQPEAAAEETAEPVKLITVYLYKKAAARRASGGGGGGGGGATAAAAPCSGAAGAAAAALRRGSQAAAQQTCGEETGRYGDDAAPAGTCTGFAPEWGGVVEGEEIEEILYDQTPSRILALPPAHKAPPWTPGAILYRVAFPSFYTHAEALQFVDAWAHSGYLQDGGGAAAAARAAAGPAAAAAAQRAAAAAGGLRGPDAEASAAAATAAHEALVAASSACRSDGSAVFGLPPTQMHVRPVSLPDGVRLVFEKPPLRGALLSSRHPHAGGGESEEAGEEVAAATARATGTGRTTPYGGSRQQGAEGFAMLGALAFAAGEAPAERSEGDKHVVAVAGYDAAGDWLPEDSIELRVLTTPAPSPAASAAATSAAAGGSPAARRAAGEGGEAAAAEERGADRLSAAGQQQEQQQGQEQQQQQQERVELVVLRGPHATGGRSQYGGVVALQVRDTEQRLLRKLQQDIAGVTLAMAQQQQQQQLNRNREQQIEDCSSPYRSPCASGTAALLRTSASSKREEEAAAEVHSSPAATAGSSTPPQRGYNRSAENDRTLSSSSNTSISSDSSVAVRDSDSRSRRSESSSRSEDSSTGRSEDSSTGRSESSSSGSDSISSTGNSCNGNAVAGRQGSSNIPAAAAAGGGGDAAAAGGEEQVQAAEERRRRGEDVEVDLCETLTAEWLKKYPGLQKTLQEDKAWLERFPLKKGSSCFSPQTLIEAPGASNSSDTAAAAPTPESPAAPAATPLTDAAASSSSSSASLSDASRAVAGTAAGAAAGRREGGGGREGRAAETAATGQEGGEGGAREEEGNKYGIQIVNFDRDARMQARMPPFMRTWTPQRREEFQRDVAYDLEENIRRAQQVKEVLTMKEVAQQLQEHFEFSDEEMQQLWHAGHAAASRGLDRPPLLLQKQQQHWLTRVGFSSSNSKVATDRDKLRRNSSSSGGGGRSGHVVVEDIGRGEGLGEEEDEEEAGDAVWDVMAGPGRDVASPHTMTFQVVATEDEPLLHHRWEELSQEEQQQQRERCRPDAVKLGLLLSELLQSPQEDLWPTICDQYKELLIGEKFLLVMKLRLEEQPPRSERERRALAAINKFAVSLFEDVQALALQNEKEQLKKIRLLCMQALVDINKLTEYAESMKHLLNRDFYAYLEHAIHAERKRIQKEGTNPDAAPSQWLLVLLIIQKGVNAIYEKEIWEDVLWMAMVVTQRQPEVRRKLLELFVAQLPKADWRQFKHVALRTAEAIAESPAAEVCFPSCPWVPAAAAQLARDLQQILPDWLIDGMLSDFDKQVLKRKMERMSFLWGEKDLQELKNVNVTLPTNIGELMKQHVERTTQEAFSEHPSFFPEVPHTAAAA